MEKTIPYDLAGERVDPGAVQTARPVWVNIATSASTGDEPTDLAETERTYLTAKAAQIADVSGDGKIAFFDVPRDWNGLKLRAEGITADQSYVTEIYLGTLGDGKRDADNPLGDKTFDCELAYYGQATWTIGTQASTTATYEMADTLVLDQTGSTYPAPPNGAISPGSNRVAEVVFDMQGADLIVSVPTTVGADSKLMAKGY